MQRKASASLVLATLVLLAFGSWLGPFAAAAAEGPPVNVDIPWFRGIPVPGPRGSTVASDALVVVGETLVATNGKWEGEPSSFAYQWLHCPIGPSKCTPIPSATSSRYSLTASDLNWLMAVEVTATNAAGSASALGGRDLFVVAPDAILKAHPHRETTSRHAKFSFKANAPKATFECKLDQAQYTPCKSPFQANLRPGSHVFLVRAVGPGGARDGRVSNGAFHWKIL